MKQDGSLTIAYTPDSDDAFYYYALERGRITCPGHLPEFICASINSLNEAACLGQYDVTAISSVLYPEVADRYVILSVGTSVGRGYGPVLVSRDFHTLGELAGRRVGIGGKQTTGAFLLRWLCPAAVPVVMPFEEIAAAVAAGHLDAGVMIHEELLYYPRLGLHAVVDLGAAWCQEQGLPLPVGLNIARRDLGRPALERICSLLRRSLEYGLTHRDEALAWVSRCGRGQAGECTQRFVDMFANADSLRIPNDVRAGLRVLLNQVAELGSCEPIAKLEMIEGRTSLTLQARNEIKQSSSAPIS
jgi:1,4-dihydroxy-6-naphthoate synthase